MSGIRYNDLFATINKFSGLVVNVAKQDLSVSPGIISPIDAEQMIHNSKPKSRKISNYSLNKLLEYIQSNADTLEELRNNDVLPVETESTIEIQATKKNR